MYISPTPESITELMQRGLTGPVTMLNLLRFRKQANYSENPELTPDEPISGAAAYQIYMEHVGPLFAAAGGEVILSGSAGALLIGPQDARWDHVLIARYPELGAFVAMTQDRQYHDKAGHRTAALEDSRLLPIVAD